MAIFEQSVDVPVTPAEAFAWHARPGAFARLQAPWEPVEVLSTASGLEAGTEVRVRLPLLGPLKMQAIFRHTHYEKNRCFVDEQIKGPFRRWRHDHRFEPIDNGKRCRLLDRIDYLAPAGGNGLVRRKLKRLFAYRQRIFKADMEHWAKRGEVKPQTVLLTGGTGLIGSALTARLQTLGHNVRILSRGSRSIPNHFHWDIEAGTYDPAAFAGVDALIHLAGSPIAKRWSESVRREILSSRIASTRMLAKALRAADNNPVRIVQASGINYYGFDLDQPVDESAPSGEGFLAEVCRQWEAEAEAFNNDGHSVALVRTGVVLSPLGGALAKLLPLFKLGLGGPIGCGLRGFPWIGLEDLVEVYVFLLEQSQLTGAFNAVAPKSASNAEFTRALGRVLRRPAIFPAPPLALRTVFGEMANETMLCNINAKPSRLLDSGFTFRHSGIAKALSTMLNPTYST